MSRSSLEKVAAHLALLEDEYVRRGMTPEEARLAARRAFGGVEQTKELQRDARSFVWLDETRRDLQYAVRVLRRAPGFTAAIVLTLAVGMGANTAIFSVISGVVLRPLGYPEGDRLLVVQGRWTDTGRTMNNLAGGDEMDIRARSDVFEAFAHYWGGAMGVQLEDHAEFVGTQLVHPDFFRVFGVPPEGVRLLNHDDAERSAVVSFAFAERNFGSSAAALGQSVFIENRSYEIVGVMPALMRFPAETGVWAAAAIDPANRNRSGHNYRSVGRLAAGVSLETANARLAALAGQIARAFPDTNGRKTFVAVPLRDNLVSRARGTLFLVMGAVALVLLIACANVANLILPHRGPDAGGEPGALPARGCSGAGARPGWDGPARAGRFSLCSAAAARRRAHGLARPALHGARLSTSSEATSAGSRPPAFASRAPGTSRPWRFLCCAAGSSTTATCTSGPSWRSSANRWRARASARMTRSASGSCAVSTSPTSG